MQCKLCGNFTSSFEDPILKKSYFYCSTCEGIFLHPKFYLEKEEEKSKYDNHHNCMENEGYVKMFEDFMDFFWEDVKQDVPFDALEFGCGPGPVLATLLEKRGANVLKYDPFYYPTKIKQRQKFSLITSTEVFEHLQNPMDTFLEVVGLLDENATLALMTLFHQNNQEEFLQWWYRRDPTHIVFYTPKTFEYMAQKAGISLRKCDNKRIITFQKK